MKTPDNFTRAYIECALWTGVTPCEPDYIEDIYGLPPDDLAPDTLAAMSADCADFQESFADLLSEAYKAPEYWPENAGHDFWLTRNRHGAGFWDRNLGSVGDRLADMARAYGESNLYLAENGTIYHEN